MKIIYLSDFNSPYSYIGLNQIKNACSELNLDVEWEMKAFELEPKANLSTADNIAINADPKEIEEIEKIAQDDGLKINYKDMTINSSKDAHRLVMYAQNKYPDVSQELVFKIFEANFTENENISNHDVLVNIAVSCGMDDEEIIKFLKSDSLEIEIYLDMEEALSYGINTIPHYFIEYNNERLIIPGVFDKESIKIALKDLISGKMKNKTFI